MSRETLNPAHVILPGSRLGVMGGGQLGRMFALEAIRMGYQVAVLDPDPQSPAGQIAHDHVCAAYQDPQALDTFGEGCAAITTEFENVPAAALRRLATLTRVAPGADAVEIAQDRRSEKTWFAKAGLRTVRWAAITASSEIADAVREAGLPAIIKTATLGYDGKGQRLCESPEAVAAAFAEFGGVPCVLEQCITLSREISVVAARNDRGEIAAYPAGENVHRNGILHTTRLPARVDTALATQAAEQLAALMESLNYIGVLALECFVGGDGQLLANEIAPRPHNSGHYTQDACACSQFEQQVRALCNLPLGPTRLDRPVAMLNLLGDVWAGGEPDWAGVLAERGAALHLYGKAAARPGRKMGHLNLVADEAAGVDEALALACDQLGLQP